MDYKQLDLGASAHKIRRLIMTYPAPNKSGRVVKSTNAILSQILAWLITYRRKL